MRVADAHRTGGTPLTRVGAWSCLYHPGGTPVNPARRVSRGLSVAVRDPNTKLPILGYDDPVTSSRDVTLHVPRAGCPRDSADSGGMAG